MPTIVSGHKAPDTDTVCSAIAYAWLLSKKGEDAKPVILGPLNKETDYVLKKFEIETPEIISEYPHDAELIIVDTNNPDELLPLDHAEVRCIIDHHKLTGGLQTHTPVPIVIKPWASTATIIWKHIKHSDHKIEKNIAGILLASILSDTLKFTSPTTTQKDEESASELANICGANIDELAREMFDAKSDLSGMSAKDVLTVDSKVFEMGYKKVRVSVLETTKPENALTMKDSMKNEYQGMIKEGSLDLLFFFAVDILNSEATLVLFGDEEKKVASQAFNVQIDSDTHVLPGVVSRKKQIIPALQPIVENL